MQGIGNANDAANFQHPTATFSPVETLRLNRNFRADTKIHHTRGEVTVVCYFSIFVAALIAFLRMFGILANVQ